MDQHHILGGGLKKKGNVIAFFVPNIFLGMINILQTNGGCTKTTSPNHLSRGENAKRKKRVARWKTLPQTTWMSQEVSKRLVSGWYPQYTPFISRLYNPFTNHLRTSWDIQASIKSPSMAKVLEATALLFNTNWRTKRFVWMVATQIFLEFSPRSLWKMNPFWRAYFSKGLVQPPTRCWWDVWIMPCSGIVVWIFEFSKQSFWRSNDLKWHLGVSSWFHVHSTLNIQPFCCFTFYIKIVDRILNSHLWTLNTCVHIQVSRCQYYILLKRGNLCRKRLEWPKNQASFSLYQFELL